jgi:putative cell wall-binding protein
MRRTIRLLAVGALTASVVVALPASSAVAQTETVLTGVDNGRGLAFDDAGNLYIASAGTGGAGPCIGSPEGEGETCYGETGQIHVLAAGDIDGTPEDAEDAAQVLVDNLPSLAPQEGDLAMGDAIGPADVWPGADGRLYFTIGLGADPAVRDGEIDGAGLEDAMAALHSVVTADGSDLTLEADLGALEAAEDPDEAGPDSNPFGVVADTDADLVTVADSGGNTVVAVDLTDADPATAASVLDVLPPTFVPAPPFIGAPNGTNIPAQAVPTQHYPLAGGGYALGQLTGFPFAVGAAGVWNVDGGGATPWYLGFTNIMDVAQGPDGALYVLEIASDGLLSASPESPPIGSLIRVTEEDGAVTRELLVDDVFMPGGLAIDAAGDWAYMTVGAGVPADFPIPGSGEVVRVSLADAEPLVTVVDDAASTDEDERLEVDVEANDTGVATATPLGISQGAAVPGSIVYQPPVHFTGDDTVPYRGCDAGEEHCLNGVLTVTVEETPTDRIAGGTRIDTAVEASMGRFPDGAPELLVARSDLYPDALAGGPLAKAIGGPILLTPGDTLDPATAAEIQRLGPTTVHVLGGTVAISDAVVTAIGDLGPDTNRISGGTRFETAVAIADVLETLRGTPTESAYVVEGADPNPDRGWPDAVAVSALAAFEDAPILLVETDGLPESTQDAVTGLDVTVIGGSVAISDATQAELEAVASSVDEISGGTRYETSQQVAEAARAAGMDAPLLTLVSGGNWPDALVAGPLAAMTSESFLRVHPSDLAQSPGPVAYMQDHAPWDDVDLFGGTVAISTEVEAGIAAATAG